MVHLGWKHVHAIGRPGDDGCDVLGTRFEGGGSRVYIVQAKAVLGGGYVGISAIQEAVGALACYSGDVAVVATNGDFTQSAYRRRDTLCAEGFDVRLWNGAFIKQLVDKAPEFSSDRRTPRPYQEEIVTAALDRIGQGNSRALFTVATGLGKTVIAAEIVSKLLTDGFRSALVLCHTRPLALQLERAFWQQIGKSLETRIFWGGESPVAVDGVLFGLYQTLVGYLPGLDPSAFDVVVIDEAHHVLAADFLRCVHFLKPKALLGMTATPWRGDGLSVESIFGPPVATVSIVDGMLMGYLAPVDYRIFTDSIAWPQVARTVRGKVSIRELNKRLFVPQRDEAVIDRVVSAARELPSPKAIIFCGSIEHCRRFTNLMNLHSSLRCETLSGARRNDQYRILMEFASNRLQAVTAVDLLNEGIDVPDVNIIVFLRPTHSRRIFVQQLGRGLRVSPETGKEKVVVLDFVTDIRRLGEALAIDAGVRASSSGYHNVVLKDGVVTFMNENTREFVEQWLQDITELGGSDDARLLEFPGESNGQENSG